MNNSKRFHLKDANIVTEVFGDEVVMVNLDSGIYSLGLKTRFISHY